MGVRGVAVAAALTALAATLAGCASDDADTDPAPSTRYVATDGDDAGAGTRADPWATLQHAVDAAPEGATVSVAPGTYDGFVLDRSVDVVGEDRDGVVVSPLTGRPAVVLVTASLVTISDLTVAGCVPVREPEGGIDDEASSGIRLNRTRGVTLERVTVRDGADRAGDLPIGCHGIYLRDSREVTVADSELTGNGSGVFSIGGGTGTVIRDNEIHDNDVLLRNDYAENNDFGAVGIAFSRTGEEPGPVAEGNTLERNRGPSADYGTDGGGFEIFEAAHVTMRDNTLANNDTVLETGTSSREFTCAGNVFSGNTVALDTGDEFGNGLVLRCAMDMQITDNDLGALARPTFQLTPEDSFGSSIAGLTIRDNRIAQGPQTLYLLEILPSAIAGLDLDLGGNTYDLSRAESAFAFVGPDAERPVPTLARWQQLIGGDADSALGTP